MSAESGERIHPVVLKELLTGAVGRPTYSLPNGIQDIELGNIARECDTLRAQTLQDLNHQEKASGMYVLPNGKVIIDSKPVTSHQVDDGMSASYAVKVLRIQIGDYQVIQDKLFAGILHTHGVYDQPQSPDDLLPLFIDPTVGGAIMSGVVTPLRRIFVFRGENTPVWDPAEAKAKIDTWSGAHITRAKQYAQQWMTMPIRTEINVADINRRIATALLNQIAQKYGLLLYSGDTASSTITAGPIK